ncbi:trimeric intracellular cation channel type A isoform X2 [Heterocephalus glaber]|uniref:Trimeric intracellular cation channel type A isoform X2 n=1 Tax=Heterocephalus glaber TaxID=10181 RepID=A0AAX6S9R3_HETGA|nr:trimeric intracellular cation channel type A isoform X2 [Heterocephalus glaber]
MELLSALSLGELALSFSRVPLFPVFDLSYFIVSLLYLKYEPVPQAPSGVTHRTGVEQPDTPALGRQGLHLGKLGRPIAEAHTKSGWGLLRSPRARRRGAVATPPRSLLAVRHAALLRQLHPGRPAAGRAGDRPLQQQRQRAARLRRVVPDLLLPARPLLQVRELPAHQAGLCGHEGGGARAQDRRGHPPRPPPLPPRLAHHDCHRLGERVWRRPHGQLRAAAAGHLEAGDQRDSAHVLSQQGQSVRSRAVHPAADALAARVQGHPHFPLHHVHGIL